MSRLIQPLNAHFVFGKLRWSLIEGLKCGSKRTIVLIYLSRISIWLKSFVSILNWMKTQNNHIAFHSFFMEIWQDTKMYITNSTQCKWKPCFYTYTLLIRIWFTKWRILLPIYLSIIFWASARFRRMTLIIQIITPYFISSVESPNVGLLRGFEDRWSPELEKVGKYHCFQISNYIWEFSDWR